MSIFDDFGKVCAGTGNAIAGGLKWTGGALADGAVAVYKGTEWAAVGVAKGAADIAVATGKAVADGAVCVYKGGERIVAETANLAVDTFKGVIDITCEVGRAIADFSVKVGYGICDILGITPEEAIAYIQQILRGLAKELIEAGAEAAKEAIIEKISGDKGLDENELYAIDVKW